MLPLTPTRPVIRAAVTTSATTHTAFNVDAQKGGGRRSRVTLHAFTPTAAACHQTKKEERSVQPLPPELTGERRTMLETPPDGGNAPDGVEEKRKKGGEGLKALKNGGQRPVLATGLVTWSPVEEATKSSASYQGVSPSSARVGFPASI